MAENEFQILDTAQWSENIFTLIKKEWFILNSGTLADCNPMTACFGDFGVFWDKNTFTCYVRPSRFSYGLMNTYDHYCICFFEASWREQLNLCGRVSGREQNKAQACGWTPVVTDSGAVYYQEARMVLECRKFWQHDLKPGEFLDAKLKGSYPNGDLHRVFVGEILTILKKS
jgi:flavin reductase (DIM6/NTAB) family NADH-FMN oxidoreductase RutF